MIGNLKFFETNFDGYAWVLAFMFQMICMILDRSVNPDLLNRHKQVSSASLMVDCLLRKKWAKQIVKSGYVAM